MQLSGDDVVRLGDHLAEAPAVTGLVGGYEVPQRRVPAGASRAEMGAGRIMGPGWISVSAESITGGEQLNFWIDAALERNQAIAGSRK